MEQNAILTQEAFKLKLREFVEAATEDADILEFELGDSYAAALALLQKQQEAIMAYIENAGHDSDCGVFHVMDCNCPIQTLTKVLASFPAHLTQTT